jgi:hypothetical protein
VVAALESFSLLGGPLNEAGRRLGLVRGTNTVRLGLVLGVGLWLVVMALAALGGIGGSLFHLSVVGVHARLLLAIPLFFMCESWVDPRAAAWVAMIADTGVVPAGSAAGLNAEVARANRRANAWWPEAAWLLMAIALEVSGARLLTYGATEVTSPDKTSMAAVVYFRVAVTAFRFLVFRWEWKLVLWAWFLWRVSRLHLRLIPGHMDRSGGLGALEGVHERFALLVAAHSILQSAYLAESMSTGAALPAPAVYFWVAMVLLIDAVVVIGPLLVFTDKLWASRTVGLGRYMTFAAQHMTEFEATWIGGRPPEGDPLLRAAAIQSMTALDGAVNVVKGMRWITAGPRLLTMMALAAIVPFLPLLLLRYQVADLAQKFLGRLIGL